MARIYQVAGKKGARWYLDYQVEGRRVRKRIGKFKRIAELALADIEVKLGRKEAGFAVKDRSLADFIGEYMVYAKGNKARKSCQRDELAHLVWADIDFVREIVAVQAKDGWHPKDYEVRHVPMTERLAQVLKARPKGDSPYVFHTQNGGVHSGNILTRDFRKLTRDCGIMGASIHTLRHTFASHLVMNGADLYTIQKPLGHSSIKTTEIYAHLAPDYLKAAMSRLKF